MPFASIEAVTCFLVFLPVRAEFPLEEKRIVKFGDILKLIYANYNLDTLRLCYPLREIENLIRIISDFLPIEVYGYFVARIRAY